MARTEKYTLVITEKPDAAYRIASALDANGDPRRLDKKGTPYYVAEGKKKIVVVPALGHLYTVAAKKSNGNYPIFSLKWMPRHEVERGAKRVRQWIETITELAEDADEFVDACDYDIEGSIIGYCILKYACGNKDKISTRMKYSTLTREELKRSYKKLLPQLDFALIEAGSTRHEVDWLYGVNLSRALTMAAKRSSGNYATISTGRVQGPTLRFLVNREKSIRSFVPIPYWEIKAYVEFDGEVFEAEYEKSTIENKKDADAVLHDCEGRHGKVEKISSTRFKHPPPPPFDLGALQSEAYKIFGCTPKRTSSIAQRLYLDALISYPRTSSQKLPPSIGYETILMNLAKASQYNKLASELLAKSKLRPLEGKKDDPAHPAIYPTGKLPDKALETFETRILDLVIRRFIAVFADSALRKTVKIRIDVNSHHFHITGKQTLRQGWLHFYKPYVRFEESLLPPVKECQSVSINKVALLSRFTNPPPRFNASSLLTKMEEVEIGTKATRAEIIQTLYNRKYVHEQAMRVTDFGLEVIEVLEDNCPTVISIELTRELEERMSRIREKREKRRNVLARTIEILKPVLEEINSKEKVVGERLSNAIRKTRLDEKIIGSCPTCKSGRLVIVRSRKTSKRFIGCTNYFKGLCKTSFPLPQHGTVRALGRNCNKCGWPMIQVQIGRRRHWNPCLNPECTSKQSGKRS